MLKQPAAGGISSPWLVKIAVDAFPPAVIDQTERRVFGKEKVPANDKIISVFEEHRHIVKGARDASMGIRLICSLL